MLVDGYSTSRYKRQKYYVQNFQTSRNGGLFTKLQNDDEILYLGTYKPENNVTLTFLDK